MKIKNCCKETNLHNVYFELKKNGKHIVYKCKGCQHTYIFKVPFLFKAPEKLIEMIKYRNKSLREKQQRHIEHIKKTVTPRPLLTGQNKHKNL